MENPTNPPSKKPKKDTVTTVFFPTASFLFTKEEGKPPRMTLKDPTSTPVQTHRFYPMQPPKNIEKKAGATTNSVDKSNDESNKKTSGLTLGR